MTQLLAAVFLLSTKFGQGEDCLSTSSPGAVAVSDALEHPDGSLQLLQARRDGRRAPSENLSFPGLQKGSVPDGTSGDSHNVSRISQESRRLDLRQLMPGRPVIFEDAIAFTVSAEGPVEPLAAEEIPLAMHPDWKSQRYASQEADASNTAATRYGVVILGCLLLFAVSPVLVNHGMLQFLTVVSYLACLSLVKMMVKETEMNGFARPWAITVCHMTVTFFISGAVAKPDFSQAIAVLPISLVTGAALLLNNTALVSGGVAFIAMVGCCTPAFTFVLQIMLGRIRLSTETVAPVLVVCAGSVMCVQAETTATMTAILLGMAATLFRSFKTVLQHEVLLTGISPIRLVFWSSFWSLTLLIPVVLDDWRSALQDFKNAPYEGKQGLIISSFLACGLNVTQCYSVKLLGALQLNVVGNLNLIMVIMIATGFMGETVAGMQYAGVIVLVTGAMLTARISRPSSELKMAEQESKEPPPKEPEKVPHLNQMPVDA